MELKRTTLFDEFGNDKDEQIINGNPTGIAILTESKYEWSLRLWERQLENFWIPQKVPLTDDITDLKKLTEDELTALKDTLGFLIYLDSLQFLNLSEINNHITSPAVNQCISAQAFFEVIHSNSYSYILQTIFPKMTQEEIFYRWKDVPALKERIGRATAIAKEYHEKRDRLSFIKACTQTYCIEGIFFYVGFIFFHLLENRNLMNGSGQIIRYIKRDELLHVGIFANLLKSLELTDDEWSLVREMVITAGRHELQWANYVYGNKILGFTNNGNDGYLKWLVNNRLTTLGLEREYDVTKNPYRHLEIDGAEKKESFFESTVTEYSRSESLDGWDDF